MKQVFHIGRRPDPDEPIEWTQYQGEEIIAKMTIRQGKKIEEREWVEDRVKAVPEGNAYCIGNGPSRKDKLDLNWLHNNGQTYGCNALYRDFIPTYLFSVDRFMSQRIVKDKVYEKTTCYAPAIEMSRSDKKLNLIPHNPHWISGNAAFWTACMHGHKNIYLLGYDFREYGKNQLNNIYQDTENYGERHSDTIFEPWLQQYKSICKRRPYCNFTIVHDTPPDYIKTIPHKNHKVMAYAEFIEKVLDLKN